jgi:hypothetical protein
VKVGISLSQLGASATRQNVLQMKRSEQEGFESLWVSERILWPLKPKTLFRGTSSNGSFPVNMQNILDPLDSLTFVAAIQRLH